MTSKGKGILGNWDATCEEIRQAMGEAVYAALREHKRAGIPAATMRDGKVILVPPEELVIPEGGEEARASTTRDREVEAHPHCNDVPEPNESLDVEHVDRHEPDHGRALRA